MSHARRLATVTSAVAAALVGVLLVATPARAEGEVEVEINGLADQVQAGGFQFDDFRATFTNVSGEAISGVFAVITVSLPGAPADTIHVQRFPGADLPAEVAGEGMVVFTDPSPFDLGRGGNDRRRVDLFLSFSDGAPEGEADITVAAYAGGTLLGSASGRTEIRGGATRTTPPNTDPGFVPTFTAGPTYSVAPVTEAAAAGPPGGTVPKAVYVLGWLLVIIGLVTLFLILRPPGMRFAGATARDPGQGRATGWPAGGRSADGPGYPRPAHPGALGSAGQQQWPVVGNPPPTRRPAPVRRDPQTGTGRLGGDRGPYTGATRPVRDPAPDDGRWRND
jgi:hypothetical protein